MRALTLVPFQLLFSGDGFLVAGIDTFSSGDDSRRDQRTGLQWLKAAREYCTWRSGASWRKLWKADERWDSERWDYLEAARLITDILSTGGRLTPAESARAERDNPLQAELDVKRGAPVPLTPEETKLLNMKRPALARELLRDPLYVDARLLSHLPKRKLVRMVVQSRQRLAADAAADRRMA